MKNLYVENAYPRICVIGAGPSGITAVKNLLQARFTNIVCYEKNADVGGNWIYSPDISHSSVFETTHIISSKKLSEYEGYPMPDDYPDYPSHDQLLRYFRAYATHFGVYNHIQFNTEVVKAEPVNNGQQWQLTLGNGNTEVFDYLLVANGHHWNPRMPNYPGNFTGQMLHSHEFKNNLPFKNKRVLVIGGGNSACDVAVETSRTSAFTAISMRRGYYIVPKFMFGKPADMVNARFIWLPRPLRQALMQFTHRVIVGDMTLYGLQKPEHPILGAHPTMNSELLYMLRHGKVHPRPDIDHYEGKTVYFKNGAVEEYDCIIAATGFNITFPFFDKELIHYTDNEVPLYKRVFHPKFRNLFFIGLVQPMGCIWPLSDAHAKLAANYIAGNYKLPQNLAAEIDKDVQRINKRYTKSHRHTIEVEYHEHLAELQSLIPANAPKWSDVLLLQKTGAPA
ncbi:monooxygenase [Sphingobacteriales bacterium UPWRP_1]|nr:monooxygenase [Sphingobacteriales bacterium TSM_CSM]PSJ76175.1 monooxygenase [Sphingobacteriales bacterium UPWRP_1]